MDSKHAILASRFATFALVFSVSACVLSHSMTEEQQIAAAKAAENEKAETNQQKSATDNNKATPGSSAVKATPATSAVKSIPGKPGSLKATNQQISKMATAGKLDQARTKPVVEQRRGPSVKKVIRYVAVDTLNIREHSSMDAPVVGKLIRGSMFQVSISGIWARIGENQFVMTKFLSTKPTKKGTSTWTYRK